MTISVVSAANLISVEAGGVITCTIGELGTVRLSRGTTANTNMFGAEAQTGTLGASTTASAGGQIFGDDLPNATGNVDYAVQGKSIGGATLTFGPSGANNTYVRATEIQI